MEENKKEQTAAPTPPHPTTESFLHSGENLTPYLNMAIDKISANGAPSHSASSTGGQLPIFGHKLLEQFPFAQGYVNLNSGLYLSLLFFIWMAFLNLGTSQGLSEPFPSPLSRLAKP